MTRHHPGLSDYDRDDDASPQSRRDRSRLTRPDNRVPGTRPQDNPLGIRGECWCGDPYPHDWEGKSDGRPHPRDGREP